MTRFTHQPGGQVYTYYRGKGSAIIYTICLSQEGALRVHAMTQKWFQCGEFSREKSMLCSSVTYKTTGRFEQNPTKARPKNLSFLFCFRTVCAKIVHFVTVDPLTLEKDDVFVKHILFYNESGQQLWVYWSTWSHCVCISANICVSMPFFLSVLW